MKKDKQSTLLDNVGLKLLLIEEGYDALNPVTITRQST